MAEVVNGSYHAIDVIRASIQWTLYNKLSGSVMLVWWGSYAKSLEPSWEWSETSEREEEFKNRLSVPHKELVRAGLHNPRYGDKRPSDFFMLGEDVLYLMKKMKRAELDNWVEQRLYEALPWLKR